MALVFKDKAAQPPLPSFTYRPPPPPLGSALSFRVDSNKWDEVKTRYSKLIQIHLDSWKPQQIKHLHKKKTRLSYQCWLLDISTVKTKKFSHFFRSNSEFYWPWRETKNQSSPGCLFQSVAQFFMHLSRCFHFSRTFSYLFEVIKKYLISLFQNWRKKIALPNVSFEW